MTRIVADGEPDRAPFDPPPGRTGSATGNLATEDLVWILNGLGIHTGADLRSRVETSVSRVVSAPSDQVCPDRPAPAADR